jgi:DNA repair exonuclease SbcCD ATPase subunit
MTALPAVPGVVAGAAVGSDAYAAAARQAKQLPDPAQLAKGELRQQVEHVKLLLDRRGDTLKRRAELLAARARVHRDDVRAAEDAAVAGTQAEAKLPAHDAELVHVVNQGKGLGRQIAQALEGLEQLRVEHGAKAVAPAAKRLQKVGDRLAQLRTELADIEDEQQQLNAVVAWATRDPGKRAEGLPVVRIGDLRHAAGV